MFGLKQITTVLFGVSKYSFQDERLKTAAELLQKGEELAIEGNFHEACDFFSQGIYMGRRAAQQIAADSKNKDSENAMDWLISSYVASANARIELSDWQKARSDAWAACTFSQNTYLPALWCMLTICENSDDTFGQLSTLKSMLPLVSDESQTETSMEDVEERIALIEAQLETKFGKA